MLALAGEGLFDLAQICLDLLLLFELAQICLGLLAFGQNRLNLRRLTRFNIFYIVEQHVTNITAESSI